MAYSNRKMAAAEAAFPELQPVTTRHLQPKPVKSHNKKQATRAECILYLLINAALLFGLVQCTRALLSDGLNLSRLWTSQSAVSQFQAQTRHENRQLHDRIRIYSSPSGIEELARNYLNMVGANELPVRFQ